MLWLGTAGWYTVRPSCQLCSYLCSAEFIHHQTIAWNCFCYSASSTFTSLPPPLHPCSLVTVLPSASATAEGHSCSLCPCLCRRQPMSNQRHHPSESGSASGDAREEETCCVWVPSWAGTPCIRWSYAREEDPFRPAWAHTPCIL